jgi:hypothetical protein
MGDGRATVAWSPSADVDGDLAGYRVYRATSTNGFVLAIDLALEDLSDPSDPRTTVSDFYSDGPWYFVVTSYDESNNENPVADLTPVSKTIVRPAVRMGVTVK